MSLDYRTKVCTRWFLDSAISLSPLEIRALANRVSAEEDAFAAFDFDSLVQELPHAAAVTDAMETFAERVTLLASHSSRMPVEHTDKLPHFSQAVTRALVERLRQLSSGDGAATTALLEARVGHLTAIQQVNNVANSTLDLEQMLDLTMQAVSEVLELDVCEIYLYDEGQDRLTLRATTAPVADAVGHVHVHLGEGVTGWAAQHGEPVAVESVREDPRFIYLTEFAEMSPYSMLSVPVILFTVNKLIGVLNLHSRTPRKFPSEEIGFSETVCGQIAIAIENARLYEQTDEKLREKVSQFTALQRVWASMASSLDLNQVLEIIARHAAELSNADRAAIFQLDEKAHDLFIVAGYNLSDRYKTMRVRVGEGAVGRSVASRTPVQVEDVISDPILTTAHPQIVAEGIRSMFCVPLIARDRVLGGISVFTLDRHVFSDEQIQLVSTFAYDAALAIENARLYQEAQRALETQAILMREMQHRVKNNLQTVASLLSLQMRRAETAEAIELLGLSAARVESIAAVHEILSEEDIGLATIEEIAIRIMDIVVNDLVPPSQKIDFTIAPAPIRLDSKQATLFALVLNELVSNAATHGLAGRSPGSIRMTATQDSGMITVEVWDNGIGMPEGFSMSTHAGLGLSIVDQLVTHELSGTFHLENGPTGCATARLKFPAKESDFWSVWWKS